MEFKAPHSSHVGVSSLAPIKEQTNEQKTKTCRRLLTHFFNSVIRHL